MAESYFVRIEDAKGMRRKVLESSKAALNVLKAYNDLIRIRSKKHTVMKSLRRELKDITLLLNQLDEIMPTLTKKEIQEMQAQQQLPVLGSSKRKAKKMQKHGTHVYLGHPEESDVMLDAPDLPEMEPEPEAESIDERMKRIEDALNTL